MQEENYKRNLWDKISESLWSEIETEVDNERIDRILKGGFLFGFTASDLMIIFSAFLTVVFLELQPYLIPYLEGNLQLIKSQTKQSVQEFQIAPTQKPNYQSKLGPTISMLITMRNDKTIQLDNVQDEIKEMSMQDSVSISINFKKELTDKEIKELKSMGIGFHTINKEIAHSGSIYGADIEWDSIYNLSAREDVIRIESSWKPGLMPPQDSSQEIGASSGSKIVFP